MPYKLSHQNHPAAIWARGCIENWEWLLLLGGHLYKEYKYRYYNRAHSAGEVLLWCNLNRPNLPHGEFSYPPQCMPDEYKRDDTVEAYRAYYLGEKRRMFKWTGREIPWWVGEEQQ